MLRNMKIVSKEKFLAEKEFYINEIRKGKIFVYPTDTIYGIGCDATNSDSVLKIRKAKKREEKPFSVIAPFKEWIKKNCVVDGKTEEWIGKLPGAYTLILKLENRKAVAKEVNGGQEGLGVRIPDNWFSNIVSQLGKPFVTTSVNLSGEKNMESIDDLKDDMKEYIDYVVYEGKKEGRGSMIVNLIGEEKIKER